MCPILSILTKPTAGLLDKYGEL